MKELIWFYIVLILPPIDFSMISGVLVVKSYAELTLINTQENWLLLARCGLRNEFRFFCLDRIKKLEIHTEKFEPHKMTLQEYFERHFYYSRHP